MIPSHRNLDRERPARTLPERTLALGLGLFLTLAALAGAQTWTPLAHQPTFGASTALLLTNGTVMVHSNGGSAWWRLTPDITGSYINGTWSQLASLPAGYAPLYYASAVLPDGRVIVEGGEYNNFSAVWTSLGAIYDPASNVWTSVAPPAGWANIGDAQSVVLANGTFMLANALTTQAALLNAATLTWTPTGSGKTGSNNEEGWTLLPNGKVLVVDVATAPNSELYAPSTGSWSLAGSTGVQLVTSSEIGPAVLRPNGTVFAVGATSNTAIYNASSGGWSAGPTFPNGLDSADGPAALLPNGNVLAQVSPGTYNAPSHFFEFNGSSLIEVPAPPNAPFDPSYVGRMLVLPTGQILFTDGSTDVEVYTPSGTYQGAWQPVINSYPSSVMPGSVNNSLTGWQLNGLSQGAIYGDDAQSATNYPLVQIINNATGHVFYARTHNHSSMGVATGAAIVSTLFDVPFNIETGASMLQVVANGIPSPAVAVTVASGSSAHFGAYEDWTGNPYYGLRGTFFPDIDGDGRADAVVVNNDRIVARRSTGVSFGGYEDWTGNPYYGTRGTFFADVDGDHKADAIVVNDDRITVRRSTGVSFGGYESWTNNPWFGSRGTFFADVDGDGRADAITVNDDRIMVRRSTGSSFGAAEDWTGNPYYGSRGTFFADVNGDHRADAIVVNDDRIVVRRSTGTP